MTTKTFGFSKVHNLEVLQYEIANEHGMKVNILSLGAAVQSIILPWTKLDSTEKPLNVVLGYDNVEDYETNDCYIGVAVGRVAGRIKNACFKVGNHEYHLTVNNGGNCLHGGKVGISRKIWRLVALASNSVELECESCSCEEGFPGHLIVKIRYAVSDNDGLLIDYWANIKGDPADESDFQGCPVNLTNHSYFNLAGIECVERGIRDHRIQIAASRTLELGADLAPTGLIVPLEGALDLSHEPTDTLEKVVEVVGGEPKGFDHYYVLDRPCVGEDVWEHPAQAVVLAGRTRMLLHTDQPGLQFYTSNFFCKQRVAGNLLHGPYGALCLEAQNYPDAINHAGFPCSLLRPGRTYRQTTGYRFERL